MAEGDEVLHRLLGSDDVVARDAWEVEPVDRRVDQHDRHAALAELGVVAVRRLGLGVQAAGEDHARDLLLEEEVDVGRLGHPTGRARAQHRREALLGESTADDVGEGREDGVLQFGEDEPDEAGPLPAQLRRTLVAEHVERRQHGLAGGLGDARTGC